MKTALVVLLIIAISYLAIHLFLFGRHHETGRGQHVGFVTAVEKNGIFWKTGLAYVKTDTQSSQEDTYCVIDDKIYQDLQAAADAHKRVIMKYFSWFFNGIA